MVTREWSRGSWLISWHTGGSPPRKRRMRTSLTQLLDTKEVLLADGATGTNYMERGLGPGDPPELWNVDHPERVRGLHQDFVDAGADIILTNTFGCSSYRLKLHNHQHRVREIAIAASRIA